MDVPRIVISALRGGAGKTIISIGIIAALRNLNKPVAPFKKGPDYIDAGWLTLAAGRPCYNLDTFLLPASKILNSFHSHTSPSDVAVIEGNRGLYDGIDLAGSTSTAELAKLLSCPVIMCLDCTKTTRTMAAVVAGCRQFDAAVAIKGVILNRVAGPRHERILTDSIEQHCGLPVIGAIPKLKRQQFPERHMGLVPTPEHDWAKNSIDAAAEMAAAYLDLEHILEIAQTAPAGDSNAVVDIEDRKKTNPADDSFTSERPKIGIIKDSAFQFYYPENIEALELAGAEVVFVSPLERLSLPQIDALYIGGGFPETHAGQLADNHQFRKELKELVNAGLPVYAECGGLMYLGKELRLNDNTYPMVDVLPVSFSLSKRPQGHGYTIVSVDRKNPFFDMGTELKGHEFHYSRVIDWQGTDDQLVFCMQRGSGFQNGRDGVCVRNVLATYTHIHALGTPVWAQAMVRNAINFKKTFTR